jgi:enoyl-CoA hydratase/carnithine racemase
VELKSTRWAVSDGIGTLTLHRPERLNAWTGRMYTELRWIFEQSERDPDVGAVVITGAGRGFCAGGDATALEGHAERGGYDSGVDETTAARPGFGVRPEFDADFAWLFGLDKPVVAAVNGPAAGIGLSLALFCDLRFAAAGAKLTTAHGKLNLPAEYGLSWILPRVVGVGRAMDLMLTSRVVLAEEAERMGLVNAVWPGDELLDRTYDYVARMLREVSPGSLASTRRQTYLDLHRSAAEAVDDARERLDRMSAEPDFAEGVAAWRARRAPRWSSR